jgi:hypothetical protein
MTDMVNSEIIVSHPELPAAGDKLDSDVIASHPELPAAKTDHVITKPSEAFILQECKQLRDEIWTRVEDQRKTERYLLLAFAIIYWFLALHGSGSKEKASDDLVACAWYVPPLLAFLAAARWSENVQLIRQIAAYTERREKDMLGSRGGWEAYLKRLNVVRVLRYCFPGTMFGFGYFSSSRP